MRSIFFVVALVAWPALAEGRRCQAVRGTSSPPSAEQVHVVFENESSSTRLLYWLDFEGHRKLYTTLRSHETYEVDSYVGHVWLFTDSRHRCLGAFVVTQEEHVGVK